VGDLFNFLTGFSRHTGYRQILVSPVTLRPRLLELIDEQAAAGERGRIVLKLNGLTDPAMIDGLYRASRAGVPIDLVVRGLCCLRPGIPELSETIRVRSVVGQFLEHSRIFRFGGAEQGSEESEGGSARPPLRLLIGSADMMERNLDRRIEVLVPVADPELQARLLEILDLVLADDTNSWSLGADRRWRRVPTVEGLNAQQRLKELALGRARRRRAPETQGAPAGS
jgi:polyphosphate kinase